MLRENIHRFNNFLSDWRDRSDSFTSCLPLPLSQGKRKFRFHLFSKHSARVLIRSFACKRLTLNHLRAITAVLSFPHHCGRIDSLSNCSREVEETRYFHYGLYPWDLARMPGAEDVYVVVLKFGAPERDTTTTRLIAIVSEMAVPLSSV